MFQRGCHIEREHAVTINNTQASFSSQGELLIYLFLHVFFWGGSTDLSLHALLPVWQIQF